MEEFKEFIQRTKKSAKRDRDQEKSFSAAEKKAEELSAKNKDKTVFMYSKDGAWIITLDDPKITGPIKPKKFKDGKQIMENFKDYFDEQEDGIDDEIFEDEELAERMWNFIIDLPDETLDSLTEDQIDDYIEIVESVAGDEDDDDEDFDEGSVANPFSKVTAAKSVLKKYQFKDAFKLPDNAAKFPLEKGYIVANKGTGTYSITDKGKNFLESVDMDEGMPAKRVRRDIIKKRKASREHRKVKAKRKIQGRRKRKTAKFKRFKKKSKRMAKRGLTSVGKRKRTFINKG